MNQERFKKIKATFLILYSFLLLSTCQQQQVQYGSSVATV